MIRRRKELLENVFERLSGFFGPQHWWPAETPFEVIVGAILTQNTAWKNVEQSISALRNRGLLDLRALDAVDQSELALLIRSSGYYNQKAKKLKTFCSHIDTNWDGDLAQFLSQDMDALRFELLGIRGIGPETADSIVLYAAEQPSFVIDTYTFRVFSRHGWIAEDLNYDELREFFMDSLDPDLHTFQEYHALLVRTGHHYCRRKPLCESCPLNGWREEE
ncbi:MAG: endonuclease III domain-containing protein [Syntrophobacteraceae bacterium]